MRHPWRLLVFVPFALVAFTIVAARLAHLDPVTRHLPHFARSIIATLALREKQGVYAIDRSLALDPENASAWAERCISLDGRNPPERLADCRKAVSLRASAVTEHTEGEAYEENNDPCAAAQAFRHALTAPGLRGQAPYYLRDQARAALACGDMLASLAALADAERLDSKVAEAVGAGNNAGREGLSLDRGYMAVVFERMHQPERASRMCAAANPGYASCSCELTGSWLHCSQTASASEMAAR